MPPSTFRVDDISKALLTRIATGGFLAAALHAVIELSIPDQLANAGRSTSELAAASGVDEDVIYRVLRALASVGIFKEEASRTFTHTRASELLRPGNTSISEQLQWMAHPAQLRAASCLLDAARGFGTSGKPALFEVLASDPNLLGCFHRAMASSTADVAAAVLDAYDFGEASLVVDVGGGRGQLLCPILQRHRHIRGVLFERPEVSRDAEAYLAAEQLLERCGIVSGDFFQYVPSGGDAYLLKHVLHDWDDERALQILTRVRHEMAEGSSARVVIVESLLSAGNRPDAAKIGDLAMLLTVGGRERTLSEYEVLCTCARLTLARTITTSAGVSIMEALPAA